VKTTFVICNLPACERNIEVLASLLSHFEIKGKKSITLGFVIPRGKPKYVKGIDPIEQPKVFAKFPSSELQY
jgi:hypothetical protein